MKTLALDRSSTFCPTAVNAMTSDHWSREGSPHARIILAIARYLLQVRLVPLGVLVVLKRAGSGLMHRDLASLAASRRFGRPVVFSSQKAAELPWAGRTRMHETGPTSTGETWPVIPIVFTVVGEISLGAPAAELPLRSGWREGL